MVALAVGVDSIAVPLIRGGVYQGVVYSASGVFITGDLGSPYTVIGVSGTADGQAIIGLSSWAAADQLLYYDASGVYADYYGITFATDDADYNLSNYPSGNSLLISTLDPNITICCQISLDMTVSAPELSTWAMMGVGFGALAYAGYRARCAAAAAA